MESTLSKIILICVALLVIVVGVFGAEYLLQPHAQTPPADTTGTSSNTGGTSNNTQTVATTPTQGQKPVTAPDIESAYASFIGQLSAQQLTFASVDGNTTGAAADIYALYSKDVAITKQIYPDATDFSIEVAAADLNGDGTAEAIVYEDLQGFCGTGGCSIDIYQDKNDKWIKIFSGLGGSDMGVSSNKTADYYDLYLTVSDGINKTVERFAWDGNTYQPKETVATWNGTAYIKTP